MENSRKKIEREKDLSPTSPELASLKEKILERQKEFQEIKESEKIVSEEIDALEKEAVKKSPGAAVSQKIIQEDTKTVLEIKNEDARAEALLKLSFEKGVYHAINVAKNLNDPYILDVFHDRLVSDFYESLIKRGKLKQL